jgi:hypothetical protein
LIEPVELAFKVATSVFSVIAPEPAVRLRAPLEVSVPEPEMVLVPVTPKEIPPLAVILLLMEIVPDAELNDSEPLPILLAADVVIEPPAVIMIELGVPVIAPKVRGVDS